MQGCGTARALVLEAFQLQTLVYAQSSWEQYTSHTVFVIMPYLEGRLAVLRNSVSSPPDMLPARRLSAPIAGAWVASAIPFTDHTFSTLLLATTADAEMHQRLS